MYLIAALFGQDPSRLLQFLYLVSDFSDDQRLLLGGPQDIGLQNLDLTLFSRNFVVYFVGYLQSSGQ